jgi:D-galacturonate reductase
MVGTGEYTTGYVHGAAAGSDKGAGVIALTLFDLRQRGIVGELAMAGVNGRKFPGIRAHLERVVGQRYGGLAVTFASYPGDEVERDADAYRAAINTMAPGGVVTIFTPDDTHFAIARAAVERGLHVLAAKPLVKTLDEHLRLMRAAEAKGVLVAMEVHKRWDPIYVDARDRIRGLGDFSFFQSYMSQPKTQLDTFRAWAGKSSDISYYLNAHHIDFHAWSVARFARPLRVYASAATGVAQGMDIPAEDTITLTVDWGNTSGGRGTGVYTASWIAPKSDVHSQQRFFYMGAKGEVTVDQAHRGYTVATDADGYRSANPLFMKYEPDAQGRFAGRSGYGYRSIEDFVLAAQLINAGGARPQEFRERLATVQDTVWVTAILEAGRKSLDAGGTVVELDV